MCRPSKIDGRCEIRLLYLLKTLILYISCMRITPRVCTSVLSFDRVVPTYKIMFVRFRETHLVGLVFFSNAILCSSEGFNSL